eukprot:m.115808 g.115808  ORF g.115808 m.115808 type:complete len:144 (-) comp28450_c0_seq3:280-711(-)
MINNPMALPVRPDDGYLELGSIHTVDVEATSILPKLVDNQSNVYGTLTKPHSNANQNTTNITTNSTTNNSNSFNATRNDTNTIYNTLTTIPQTSTGDDPTDMPLEQTYGTARFCKSNLEQQTYNRLSTRPSSAANGDTYENQF